MDEEQEVRVARYLENHITSVGKRIYSLIKDAPLTKTDLRKRTSLPVKQLDDELNALAGYNLIKAVKKPEKKNLNVWVLFHEKEEQQQQEEKAQNEDLISLILKKDSTIALIKKEAIRKSYSLDKFQYIMEMLKLRGQIDIFDNQVRIRTLNKIQVPCITCQLRRLCQPGSSINPSTCPYLLNW